MCTSCRPASEPRSERAGARLFASLVRRHAAWARREGFRIEPVECLSVCPRPCGIALAAPGKYTYVFGDLAPDRSESAIVECATMYRRAASGFLPREDRPRPLQAGVLARIPPIPTD